MLKGIRTHMWFIELLLEVEEKYDNPNLWSETCLFLFLFSYFVARSFFCWDWQFCLHLQGCNSVLSISSPFLEHWTIEHGLLICSISLFVLITLKHNWVFLCCISDARSLTAFPLFLFYDGEILRFIPIACSKVYAAMVFLKDSQGGRQDYEFLNNFYDGVEFHLWNHLLYEIEEKL